MTKGHAKGSSDLSMQQVRCSLTGKQCSWLVWWCCFIWSHRNNSHLPCRKPDRIENGERTRSRHTRRDGKSLTLSKRKESCKQTTNNGNGERKEPFKLWEQKSQQVCLRPADSFQLFCSYQPAAPLQAAQSSDQQMPAHRRALHRETSVLQTRRQSSNCSAAIRRCSCSWEVPDPHCAFIPASIHPNFLIWETPWLWQCS